MTESEKLFVYGAGGHAKSVIGVIEHEGRWDLVGVIDETASSDAVLGYEVLGGFAAIEQLVKAGITKAHVAIGDNYRRSQMVLRLQSNGVFIERVIHPSAVIMKDVGLGVGSFFHACSVIGPEAQVGDHSIVSAHATIGHESKLGRGVHLSPSAQLGGNVNLGDYCTVGLGAAILPGVTVGANTVIGANAVVTKDLPEGVVAVGMPAKVLEVDAA